MAAVPDAQTVLSKWKTNTNAAADRWVAGAEGTTVDPTAAAIAAGQRYYDRVVEAFQSGKWANGLRRSGRAGWLGGIQTGGRAKFQAGVTNADAKFTAAFTPLLAYISTSRNTVLAMPNLTDADRDARMLRMVQLMRQYRPGG